MIFGGFALLLIVQLFTLAWAMFVAGRKGALYIAQVIIVIVLSLACLIIAVLESTTIHWFHLIQVVVFFATAYVIFRYHDRY